MREECVLEGRPPKPLVFVRTADKLATVVRTLFEAQTSSAPILSCSPCDSPGSPLPSVLHIATLSGVLNCLMRHFRASLASLPLLALPLSQLPIGTWAPEQQFMSGGPFNPLLSLNPGPQQQQQEQQQVVAAGGVKTRRSSTGAEGGSDGGGGGGGGVVGRIVSPLHAVTLSTPLTTALGMLLEAGVSRLMGTWGWEQQRSPCVCLSVYVWGIDRKRLWLTDSALLLYFAMYLYASGCRDCM